MENLPLMRCFNRMNDLIDICKVSGSILLDGVDILDKRLDLVRLRTKVGMVFQKPNLFLNLFMIMLLMGLKFMVYVKMLLN